MKAHQAGQVMATMRIAMVTECYHPVRNGIVSVIDTLVVGLRERGHEVLVIAPDHPSRPADPPFVVRVPSLPNPFYPDYPAAKPWSPVLRRALDEFRPEVVHTHSFMWLSRFALKQARKRGIPVVTTYHTLVTEYLHYAPVPKWLAHRFVAHWSASFCNACQCVIVVSPLGEKLLRSFGVTTPIEFIPTGIDADRFGQGDGYRVRKSLGIPMHGAVLLYVGRIAKEKNVAFLLDALTPVLAERARTYLVLVGDGPEMAAMQAKAKGMAGGERILFVGSRPREEIPDFFAAADIFVFASVTEMQGLSVCEALMAGLPVVAVGEGGVRYYLRGGETGFVTPLDKVGFANAVRALLDKPHLRMAMAERARSLALQQFSVTACLDRLERVYRQVMVASPTRV